MKATSESNVDLSDDDLPDDVDVDDQEDMNKVLYNLQDMINSLRGVEHVRCCEHTLQLCINEGLKKASHILAKIRHAATKARNPITAQFLKARGYLQPILDVITRWGSTFIMLKRMVELRKPLTEIAEMTGEKAFRLTNQQWEEAEQLKKILQFPYDITMSSQRENLTAGDFMYCWKKMLHNLKKFKSPISRCIADAMVHRESTLFSSTFFASVSVDPSNCTMLTDDQEEEAKVKILSLLQKQQVMFLKS